MGMISKNRKLGRVLLVAAIVLAGCSQKVVQRADPERDYVVNCIAVLPARTVPLDSSMPVSVQKQLQDGKKILDKLLREKFIGSPRVRMVTQSLSGSLLIKEGVMTPDRARTIADHLSCNALLDTTISRYVDRQGGIYMASKPASVAFSYTLFAVPSNRVLCQGQFSRTQQSITDNFLSYLLDLSHILTWRDSEQLLRKGLSEKFSECRYLASFQ